MEHKMITSASGWRKVFAESGEKDDDNGEIGDLNRTIAALAAETFADYMLAHGISETVVKKIMWENAADFMKKYMK